MRTVQMTLDEELIAEIDRMVKEQRTTRSAFAREALRREIRRRRTERLEESHRAGYRKRPVGSGEFAGWEGEQVWGDE